MKCLIVSGGTPPSYEIFIEELNNADILIAADKGAETYFRYGVTPHYILGDLDSVQDISKEFMNSTEVIRFNPEKDFTDSELAVNEAIELGAKELTLLGFTGTRMDHFIANLGLLEKCLKRRVRATIKDSHNEISLVDKKTSFFGKEGQFITFQALEEKVRGFSIKGAKYELENYTLSFGDPRTVSNEFLNKPIEIDFETGKVLVIYSND